MVLDTWPASVLYNTQMNQSHVQAMRKDGGGMAFMLHCWLGAKIMIKIFDVAGERHLTAAEGFLRRMKETKIPVEGRVEAVEHWEVLHVREQRSPFPLSQLVKKDLTVFKTILKDEFKKGRIDSADRENMDTMSLGYRYKLDEFVRAGWNASYWFVVKIEAKKTLHMWLAMVSMRLYALLPHWAVGCEDNCLFPAVILLTKSWYASMEKQVDRAHDSTSLCLLEFLPEQWCLPWTYGVVGSSNLRKWWTEQVRGLHRIVWEGVAAMSLGCRMARLSKVLEIVESIELRKAFEAAEEFNTEFAKLRQRCGASRSGTASKPILATIVEQQEERNGKLLVVQGKMVTWESFDFREWALGWRDEPNKWMSTMQGGLGWLLLEEELRIDFTHKIFDKSPASQHLIRMARVVGAQQDLWQWWELSHEGFNKDEGLEQGEGREGEEEEEEEEEEEQDEQDEQEEEEEDNNNNERDQLAKDGKDGGYTPEPGPSGAAKSKASMQAGMVTGST
ncbi:hypothetical protein FRC06_000720 [Ceratobasidium sp. 370]|nr:hypothetical protein FRC06_000720 [Ceratobasidium sp. 370]